MTRRTKASREEAERDCAAVTAALRAGYPAVKPKGAKGLPSATGVAGAECGVDRNTFFKRVGMPGRPGSHFERFGLQPDWSIAAARGELGTAPVLPGYELAGTSTQLDGDGKVEREWVRQRKAAGALEAIPAGHVVKGLSVLQDGQGRTLAKWVKTREGRTPADAAAEIREALASIEHRAEPCPAPDLSNADLATVYIAADWHVGLLTWKGETGTNWDLKIARKAIGENVARLVAASPASEQAVVLGLGDLLHADGYDNATPASKHVLDVDSRYPRILGVATRLMIEAVSRALEKHVRVLVRVLPGNHDPESAVAVNLALSLYYEHEPRVTVDDSASPFWWWEWGAVFLGAAHGDAAKMKDLPLIMAARNAEAWGRSRFRHILTGHIHSQTGIEMSGVTVESFQAPIPSDAWHHRQGYGGGRSLCSITYDRTHGEIGRAKVNLI